MGRRLRVVEITLQAGESATSGVLWFILRAEIESGDPGARAGRRDIQIPYYRIEYRILLIRYMSILLIRPGIPDRGRSTEETPGRAVRTGYGATVVSDRLSAVENGHDCRRHAVLAAFDDDRAPRARYVYDVHAWRSQSRGRRARWGLRAARLVLPDFWL